MFLWQCISKGTFSKMSKNKSLQPSWSLSHTEFPRWQSSSFPHQLVWTWCPGFVLQTRIKLKPAFAVVQSLSPVWLFAAPWTAALQASLSFTVSWSLLKLMSIGLVMSSSHLIPCHPLLLLPSIFPSIRVFFNESVLCIRWPKYWNFSFIITPSNEYSWLISFRMDWFDLLQSKGLSRVFSNTTVQKHQFFGTQFSLWPNSHIHMWLLEKP